MTEVPGSVTTKVHNSRRRLAWLINCCHAGAQHSVLKFKWLPQYVSRVQIMFACYIHLNFHHVRSVPAVRGTSWLRPPSGVAAGAGAAAARAAARRRAAARMRPKWRRLVEVRVSRPRHA